MAPNFTDLYCFFSSMPPTIYIFKRSFKQANKYLDHCLLLYSHQKTCVLFLFELQITFVRYFGLIVIFYISINFLSNVKFLKSSGIEHFRVWISVLCFFLICCQTTVMLFLNPDKQPINLYNRFHVLDSFITYLLYKK